MNDEYIRKEDVLDYVLEMPHIMYSVLEEIPLGKLKEEIERRERGRVYP